MAGRWYRDLPLKLEQRTGWLYGKASREDPSELYLLVKLLLFSQHYSKMSNPALGDSCRI